MADTSCHYTLEVGFPYEKLWELLAFSKDEGYTVTPWITEDGVRSQKRSKEHPAGFTIVDELLASTQGAGFASFDYKVRTSRHGSWRPSV